MSGRQITEKIIDKLNAKDSRELSAWLRIISVNIIAVTRINNKIPFI